MGTKHEADETTTDGADPSEPETREDAEPVEPTPVEAPDVLPTFTVEGIAQACHEVNRALCGALDDKSQKPWAKTPADLRASIIDGVRFRLAHPKSTPEDSHNNWLQFKTDEGWRYGPKKDVSAKTHPCYLPYDKLPIHHRVKDTIFVAVVDALKPMLVKQGK